MKLRTVLVFGVGYVIGTKAGRERYEQILSAAKRRAARLGDFGQRLEQYSQRSN